MYVKCRPRLASDVCSTLKSLESGIVVPKLACAIAQVNGTTLYTFSFSPVFPQQDSYLFNWDLMGLEAITLKLLMCFYCCFSWIKSQIYMIHACLIKRCGRLVNFVNDMIELRNNFIQPFLKVHIFFIDVVNIATYI